MAYVGETIKISLLKSSVVLGAIWFFALVLLVGSVTPGYSHVSQAISELGESGASYAWLINCGGFLPLGIVFITFAFVMPRFSGPGASQTVTFTLFGLMGIALVAAGIFQCDPGGRRDTLAGILHALAGITILMVSSMTPFIVAISRSCKDSLRRWFRAYSFVTGIVLLGLFLMTPNAIMPGLVELQHRILGELFPTWYNMLGLHQRAFMVIYFVWVGIFARLYECERI